jgi:hypothetical protein
MLAHAPSETLILQGRRFESVRDFANAWQVARFSARRTVGSSLWPAATYPKTCPLCQEASQVASQFWLGQALRDREYLRATEGLTHVLTCDEFQTEPSGSDEAAAGGDC